MRSAKKILRYTLRTLLGIIAFLVLYVIAALGLQRISTAKEQDNGQDVAIYILTNGVHTDIVVPVHTAFADWSSMVPYSNTHLTDTTAGYLALFWGDKGFYLQTPTWADLKFSVAFKAATGLSSSAMHATYYQAMREGKDCHKILISSAQYQHLISFVKESFRHTTDGQFINIKTNANYSKADAFYEAVGSYSLFYTCNTWANQALKSCGQKAALWTVLDTGIFSKYE